jgi:hypothetical protein
LPKYSLRPWSSLPAASGIERTSEIGIKYFVSRAAAGTAARTSTQPMRQQRVFIRTPVVRESKRGFGAMVRELIFCTGARSATAEDILHQTVADLRGK